MLIVIEPSPMWGRELFSAKGAKEGWGLHYRQCNPANLLIDIQCIHIRHATNIIQHRHDARLKVVAADVILTGETVDELL